MSEPVDVSVVIPAYNADPYLGSQLTAVEAQEFDGVVEVVIADNGSSDDTVAVAQRFVARNPTWRVVDASRAPGGNVARNVGVAAALAPVIALCDADDIVNPGWLSALVSGLDHADLVSGRLVVDRINSPEICELYGSPPPLEPNAWGERYAFSGNCCYRREVWERVGGYDEDFVDGFDEVDFAARATRAGFRIIGCEEAVVDYRLRGSLRGLTRQRYRHGIGAARFLCKHPDVKGWTPREKRSMVREGARQLRGRADGAERRAIMLAMAFLLGLEVGSAQWWARGLRAGGGRGSR